MIFSDFVMPPKSLLIYDALRPRKTFSPQDKQRYKQIYKGFIGEKRFEKHIKDGDYPNVLPLFGYLFEVGDREFQIDCILLTANTIFLLEVKNYTGDYYIENNKVIHLETKREIFNPINQLKRTEFLFKKLLDELKITCKLRPLVLFVNHNFMLYDVPVGAPIVFPSQINRFLQKINANVEPITSQTEHIAKTLIRKRKKTSTYERIPEYELSQLNEGVFCKDCFAGLKRVNKFKIICANCKKTYKADDLVLYTVAQYHLLFPEKRISTQAIVDWCGGFFSKNSIRRILAKNLRQKSNGAHSYYYYDDKNEHWKTLINRYL